MLSFASDTKKKIYRRKRLCNANKYLQTTYKTAAELTIEEHLRTCADVKFHVFPFFKILQ